MIGKQGRERLTPELEAGIKLIADANREALKEEERDQQITASRGRTNEDIMTVMYDQFAPTTK